MIEILSPLGELPGVEFVMLLSPDGMPIAVAEGSGNGEADSPIEGPLGSPSREEATAALVGGWSNEITHAVAPLSWQKPERVVLRCARGSLVMRPMRGAILLLILDTSMSTEEVRLPMDGVVARLERALRTDSTRAEPEPAGALPAASPSSEADSEEGPVETFNTSSQEGLSGD